MAQRIGGAGKVAVGVVLIRGDLTLGADVLRKAAQIIKYAAVLLGEGVAGVEDFFFGAVA